MFISNPLQVEAYHYPKDYGPNAPSFARAAVLRKTLYLSGTASIRGHQTLHVGDVASQTQVTLENIERVIQGANEKTGLDFSLSQMALRVYLRASSFRKDVERILSSKIMHFASISFLEADICRESLLIEIEGITHAL